MRRELRLAFAHTKHALKLQSVRLAMMAAALGALGFLLFGTTPRSLEDGGASVNDWSLEAPGPLALDAAQATLQATPFWASQPVAVAVAEAGPAKKPVPRLLGVITEAGRTIAVFQTPDGRRLRAAQGESLETGERIDEISPTHVRWVDGDNGAHEARLFDAPQNLLP